MRIALKKQSRYLQGHQIGMSVESAGQSGRGWIWLFFNQLGHSHLEGANIVSWRSTALDADASKAFASPFWFHHIIDFYSLSIEESVRLLWSDP